MRVLAAAAVLAFSLVAGGVALAGDEEDGDKAFRAHDYPTALKLLEPLLARDSIAAEIDLGAMYISGNGVTKDLAKARRLFAAAARQGNKGGQIDLGISYATGEGGADAKVMAYVWFAVAATGEDTDVATRYRDHIATELSPDDLARAQAMAKVCRESSFKDCGAAQ